MDQESIQEQRMEFTRNWVNAQESIRLFIYTSINNANDADDILQEVACQIAQKYDSYDSSRPFLPWAIGVSKIKIAEYYRGQKRDNHVLMGEFLESLSEACFRLHSQLHPYSAALEECLKTLDSKSERLLSLRYSENLKPQQIADELNTTYGSIQVLLNRVRNRLRKCMKLRVEQNEK